jgi:hypothetical protein
VAAGIHLLASWPLTLLSRNITAVDCTNVEELLNWLAWLLTNDAYRRTSTLCGL